MATSPKNIGVIIGSTRVNRIGDQVADFVKSTLSAEQTRIPVTLTLIDIKSFNLPVFDEAVMPAVVPAQAQFAHEHSKAWNAEIEKYDAYVFTTAEYNFGVPGGTKNAIDYLYHVWIGKPILIVSYGIMGGSSASASLKTTLEGMRLQVVETRPSFEFPERNPKQHNMSPGLMGAVEGMLVDSVVKDWRTRTSELLQGYRQLVEKLEA
jgi:NAD(P)H-dependent FMN reductase